MKQLTVIVLSVMMLLAGLAGVAVAQQAPDTATLGPFSAQMNFMSEAGYARYLNHQRTGQWTPFTP